MLRFLAFSVLCLTATPGVAQDVEIGGELFTKHCATCHGLEAIGNGPMAPALMVQPTDLTGLAAGNGGDFPLMRVVMRIDGRDPLVSHGSSMPVYGDFFDVIQGVGLKTETGQPVMVSAPVADLIVWLQSIQD